jgi:hypothetical protein
MQNQQQQPFQQNMPPMSFNNFMNQQFAPMNQMNPMQMMPQNFPMQPMNQFQYDIYGNQVPSMFVAQPPQIQQQQQQIPFNLAQHQVPQPVPAPNVNVNMPGNTSAPGTNAMISPSAPVEAVKADENRSQTKSDANPPEVKKKVKI